MLYPEMKSEENILEEEMYIQQVISLSVNVIFLGFVSE